MIKIAIIDDHLPTTNILEKYLSRFSYFEIVGVAHDGKEGLELIQQQPIDILLLDLVMPYIDGMTVLEKMESHKPDMEVIILSALGNEQIKQRAYTLGAKHFLYKPINLEQLLQLILKLSHLDALPNSDKSVSLRDDKSLEIKTSELLKTFGIPVHLKGYSYIKEAIKLLNPADELKGSITTVIYPAIAEKYQTTPGKVERSIRHAIEVAWQRSEPENLQRLFKTSSTRLSDRPTNSVFISILLENLRV